MEMQHPAQSSNVTLTNTWIGPSTGDAPVNMQPYIGDFPPPAYPFGPIQQPTVVPIPQRLYPSIPIDRAPDPWVNPGWGTITTTSWPAQPTWRTTHGSDCITASVDMPGIRIEDLTVELENGIIKASGKRFDNALFVSHTHSIGTTYDPATSEASLEAGVLTVTVRKFKDKITHKVRVKAK